jgi:hypothetical protein
MAMTASPIMDASKTRHPSCSRMGIRILTIALHTRRRRVFFCYNGRPRARRRSAQWSVSAQAAAEEQERGGRRGRGCEAQLCASHAAVQVQTKAKEWRSRALELGERTGWYVW